MTFWNTFSRPHKIFVWLVSIFVICLVIADLTGAMLFSFFIPWPGHKISVLLSAGIIPFPITFILTDLVNEFYGKEAARFMTWIGFVMCFLVFTLLSVGGQLPVDERTLIPKSAFDLIASQYTGMFIASLTAYLIGQMLDIQVFHSLRSITKHRFIWLRATGSTVVSQLIDSLLVSFLAFSGQMAFQDILHLALSNYTWKFLIAIGITPLLYLGHWVLARLMPHQEDSDHLSPEYN